MVSFSASKCQHEAKLEVQAFVSSDAQEVETGCERRVVVFPGEVTLSEKSSGRLQRITPEFQPAVCNGTENG